MNITFECLDKVSGVMTLVVDEADYTEGVEKTLKDYRKKANVPGFRPGMAPMGMIRRQYEAAVKIDVVNKLVGEQMYKYMEDNNIHMLGEPLASDRQVPIDIEGPAPYTFIFDIAVAPQIDIELGQDDKLEYTTITVSQEAIDSQVDMYASRKGSHVQVDCYEANDMVKGDLTELTADGVAKDEGISVDGAVVMPTYIKGEEQKALFDGAKVGDTLIFNPKKAYPDSDVEVASLLRRTKDDVVDLTADFSYKITEITRFVKAPVDQDLFDSVFAPGTVTDEEQFRQKVAEGLRADYAVSSDHKFGRDLRKYCEDKVGDVAFPDALLKRILLSKNKDKGADYVESNYDGSIKELKWQLIRDHLAKTFGIQVDADDVRATARDVARMQFAGYGMSNVPEEYINNFADEMLKKEDNVAGLVERALTTKLEQTVKTKVTLVTKEVTLDEFNQAIADA